MKRMQPIWPCTRLSLPRLLSPPTADSSTVLHLCICNKPIMNYVVTVELAMGQDRHHKGQSVSTCIKHIRNTYLFLVYLTTLFRQLRLYSVEWEVISEWWIGKDLEESNHGLILRHYPGIRQEGLKKFRIAGVRTEIWTWVFPITKQGPLCNMIYCNV
jgi:hypothetical protein